MSEWEMQKRVATILEKDGYEVFLEVPFLTRSIDIVALKDGRIYTYELKLHDWKKAIIQSLDHMHGADESFICLPERAKLNDDLVELAQSNGIGLLFYDMDHEEIKEVLPAQDSEFCWPPAKKWLSSALGVAA